MSEQQGGSFLEEVFRDKEEQPMEHQDWSEDQQQTTVMQPVGGEQDAARDVHWNLLQDARVKALQAASAALGPGATPGALIVLADWLIYGSYEPEEGEGEPQ